MEACPICGLNDVGNLAVHLSKHSKEALIESILSSVQIVENISASTCAPATLPRPPPPPYSISAPPLVLASQIHGPGHGPHDSDDESAIATAIITGNTVEVEVETESQDHHGHGDDLEAYEFIDDDDHQQHHHHHVPSSSAATGYFVNENPGEENVNVSYFNLQVEAPPPPYTMAQIDDDDEDEGANVDQVVHVSVNDNVESGPSRGGATVAVEVVNQDQWKPSISHHQCPTSSGLQINIIDDSSSSSSSSSSNISTKDNLPDVRELMTDEEFPAHGEISEYEESISYGSSENNSESSRSAKKPSSENKNSSFKISNIVGGPKNQEAKKKNSSVIASTSSNSERSQFSCYDCFQNFNSLFELIEHKVELHKTSKSIGDGGGSGGGIKQLFNLQQDLKPGVISSVETKHKPYQKKQVAFLCVYCNLKFKKLTELSNHLTEVHPDKPANPTVFPCCICGKSFSNRVNFRKHLLIHKEKKFICTEVECKRAFITNTKLQLHMMTHVSIFPFKCEFDNCVKAFRTAGNLKSHQMVHDPLKKEKTRMKKKKTEFFCRECNSILHSKRALEGHMEIHSKIPKKCEICQDTFLRTSTLIRHIRVFHDKKLTSETQKECPVCKKLFHPNSLRSHLRIHNNDKPHQCKVCFKYFRTLGNLASHSWLHTNNEKPFRCTSCPKAYIYRKELENHMIVHRKHSMFYPCNECGVKFTYKNNMRRHFEEHFIDKKFKCHCGKEFHRKYYLIEHQRIHNGEKPFHCTICGKCSTTRSNHKAHLKIHEAQNRGEAGQNLEN